MNAKIARRIATNPRAAMDFKARGKIPRLRKPEKTPLWLLLSRLTTPERLAIGPITLGPHLGYQSNATFSNAERLWRWLGANDDIGDWETPPCETLSIKSFRKNLSKDDIA